NLKRVLGVIRPTAEVIGNYTNTNNIGILGTTGTIQSKSYILEIEKFFPSIKVYQQACPMWVPLIENNEYNSKGADYFVKKYINQLTEQSADIDSILLACTHYPLLINKIREYAPADMAIVTQGEIVATSLSQYLNRHQQLDAICKKEGSTNFFTTDDPLMFNKQASIFYGKAVESNYVSLHLL
ncbi:MAG TPA: aspartate/glutamate racemase family protein, partial [Chitinophagaceae bacterium]|nr:aspartate/glutamate racemase family protein [Chitinophagaceae bacterium]